MNELFVDKNQSAAYAAYRPSYPPELFDVVLRYLHGDTAAEAHAAPHAAPHDGVGAAAAADGSETVARDSTRRPGRPLHLAVDVGCGSGQATQRLARHFARVVATDVSQSQIDAAPEIPGVEWRVAPAHETGVGDGEVDLVTVAQALHWFPLTQFWGECNRVLRPGGAVACWGYGLPEFSGNPRAQAVLMRLHDDTLGEHWAPGRVHIVQHYAGLEAPSPLFVQQRRVESVRVRRCMPMPAVRGYLTSWSAYTTLRRKQPHAVDPLHEVEAQLRECYGLDGRDDDTLIDVAYPIFLLLARKPL